MVAESALAMGLTLLGFLDDNVGRGTRIGELMVLGSADWLDGHRAGVVLGVGENTARERIAGRARRIGLELTTVVHPRSFVAPSAVLGAGAVVLPLAVVHSGARIGSGAIVNSGAVVEHDVQIGDFAHVSPNATLGGGARLGDGAHLGLSACVLPGRTVGSGAVVGAGAVVTRDVVSAAVVVGVPARTLQARVRT